MKNLGVNAKEAVVMLVGNKCDGRVKEVDQAEAIAFAKKRGYEYFPCSASTGENVNEIFEKAFGKAVAQLEDKRKTLQ
jgi:GTPase SAR1 family protein